MIRVANPCRNCGKSLPRESTARRKFCGDNCRVEYHRSHDAQQCYNRAFVAIDRLGRVPANQKTESIDALRELKKMIDQQLRYLGDRETIEKYQMLTGRSG